MIFKCLILVQEYFSVFKQVYGYKCVWVHMCAYTQFFAKLECDDKSQLYDFTTHNCVSECPCGFFPFRLHHTAYCRAGIITVVCYIINLHMYECSLTACNFMYVCMRSFPENNYMAEFLNDHSLVKISFNAPPSSITTNIDLYINFPHIFDYIRWFGSSNSTVVARLTLVSSYSGISLPNNTILPVVSLIAPEGTEGAMIDIPLKNDSRYIKYCNTFQNSTFISVQAKIHSPLTYSQLGQYDFVVELELFSPDSTSLDSKLQRYYWRDRHTLTVNITYNGNLHLQILCFI